MNDIQGSVGHMGTNLRADVRFVQGLLNRHDLSPLAPLSEDGQTTPLLIEAIRHFQVRYLHMRSPDGRVDPGGRTLARLKSGSSQRGTGENAETRQADRGARAKLVDPRVKETAVTTRIIDRLTPHLQQVRARVISGYLSDSDLFWKVNYHWEYLLNAVEHALTLPLEEKHKKDLQSIRSSLLSCPPSPSSGYTSGALGKPQDNSSQEEITKRHKLLSAAKQEFGKVVAAADIKRKSKKSERIFDLAAAPVAHPGTSKHSTGYALDIEGDRSGIKSICKGAGATLVFDEKSHVHVEFKNGVA
jgi:hypothetical protein